jgi:hypothetical protein
MRAGKRQGFEVDGEERFDYHFDIPIPCKFTLFHSVAEGVAD